MILSNILLSFVAAISMPTSAAQNNQSHAYATAACHGTDWQRRGYASYQYCYDAHIFHWEDVHLAGGDGGGGGGGGGGGTNFMDIKGYEGSGAGCSGSRLNCREEVE